MPPVILQTLYPLYSLQLRPTTHWSTYTVMAILCRTSRIFFAQRDSLKAFLFRPRRSRVRWLLTASLWSITLVTRSRTYEFAASRCLCRRRLRPRNVLLLFRETQTSWWPECLIYYYNGRAIAGSLEKRRIDEKIAQKRDGFNAGRGRDFRVIWKLAAESCEEGII